jgi:hypothetical protein
MKGGMLSFTFGSVGGDACHEQSIGELYHWPLVVRTGSEKRCQPVVSDKPQSFFQPGIFEPGRILEKSVNENTEMLWVQGDSIVQMVNTIEYTSVNCLANSTTLFLHV